MKNENGERVRNPEAYSPGLCADAAACNWICVNFCVVQWLVWLCRKMTGSVGVVTINMARLGYRFKGDRDGLMVELDRLMDLSSSTLEKKRLYPTHV